MKIKNLYIHDYKNLKNVDFKFNPKNLTVVQVGHNGLGKSNFLESLASIFSGLWSQSFEDLKSWSRIKFGYRINFFVYNYEVDIMCSENDFTCRIKTPESDWRILDEGQFNRGKQDILPKYVVGYYSGENERFKNIINQYEDGVWRNLKEQKNVNDNFRSLFYTDPAYSQLLLLTMVLYTDFWKDKNIENLFDEFTSFENVLGINIKLKNPVWYKKRNLSVSGVNISANYIESNRLDNYEYPFWNIKGSPNEFINILYENSSYQIVDDIDEELDPLKLETLDFVDLDFELTCSAIRDKFGEPMDFFYMLDSLRVIGALDEIDIFTKIKSVTNPIHVTELSEGEQQLFTVLGVLLLFGNDETLFLFDEPDTHLNPAWQRKYDNLLKEFNLNDNISHIFYSTHNPIVVQEITDADVILFNTEGAKVLTLDELHKVKNYRIDNLVMSPLFDLNSSYGSVHNDYVRKRNEILRKEKMTATDKIELEKLLDNLDYLATGETIEEIEDSLLIRKYANKLREIIDDKD